MNGMVTSVAPRRRGEARGRSDAAGFLPTKRQTIDARRRLNAKPAEPAKGELRRGGFLRGDCESRREHTAASQGPMNCRGPAEAGRRVRSLMNGVHPRRTMRSRVKLSLIAFGLLAISCQAVTRPSATPTGPDTIVIVPDIDGSHSNQRNLSPLSSCRRTARAGRYALRGPATHPTS